MEFAAIITKVSVVAKEKRKFGHDIKEERGRHPLRALIRARAYKPIYPPLMGRGRGGDLHRDLVTPIKDLPVLGNNDGSIDIVAF